MTAIPVLPRSAFSSSSCPRIEHPGRISRERKTGSILCCACAGPYTAETQISGNISMKFRFLYLLVQKRTKIINLRCLFFVVRSNILMFDMFFPSKKKKNHIYPDSSLTSLDQVLRTPRGWFPGLFPSVRSQNKM